MKKPNLFLVGESKSGTTALFDYLTQHPKIKGSRVKEPMYFANDFIPKNSIYKKLDEYLKLFDSNGKEEFILDGSTLYLPSEDAAKNIHNFNSQAKIIAIFREPSEFLESLHFTQLMNGVHTISNIEEIFMKKHRRIKKTLTHYLYRVKYTEQLKRFTELFPVNQIKVIIYDDFKDDNQHTVNEILDFLGLEPMKIKKQVINPSREIRFKWARYILISILNHLINQTKHIKAYWYIRNKIDKLTLRNCSPSKMKEELRKTIKLMLKEEVIRFNDFIKNKGLVKKENLIKKWGYNDILKRNMRYQKS